MRESSLCSWHVLEMYIPLQTTSDLGPRIHDTCPSNSTVPKVVIILTPVTDTRILPVFPSCK